jgi:hypothetical protein
MTRDPADEPIELHLPDGGQVIVTISDRIARDGDRAVELVVAMVSADGSEPASRRRSGRKPRTWGSITRRMVVTRP